ncbi:PaaX family transcriptional regulator [Microcella sp.]|uniref:PaaX family transcriptional regulator n=1 Tax=Microcella sp. TaxID=1913979 RepID=UPI003F72CF60
MTAFDDIDARPGSTTSILRTIIGLYLRRVGGWIAISDLIALMEDLGIPAARTRTGVVRLKKKGLLVAERAHAIGYRLNSDSERMLERGDRRIFHVRQMGAADAWCLVSFSIPENQRDLRHQLRRRLQWIGCGLVAPALWVCPDYLSLEVEEIVHDLGVERYVLFRTEEPRVADSLPEAVATWWDLELLREEHESFLRAVNAIEETEGASALEAFIGYVTLIDNWRILPYIDPGLPAHLLPSDWPGQRSIDGFLALSERLQAGAWSHVTSRVSPVEQARTA